MENIKIVDFKEAMNIEGYYLIKSVDLKTTNSNNKKYMDFNFCDNSGEINAKLWDIKNLEEKFENNTIVKVKGTILAWQNSLQLKIETVKNVDETDEFNIDEFIQSAPIKSADMYKEIERFLKLIKNEDIKNIVAYGIEENKEKLMYHPAAKKNHHAIRGGLLYHTVTMLKAAEKLVEIYSFLNKDLIYGGIILHDICKIEEMDSNKLGFVKDYTVPGQLLGHITLGASKIAVIGDALGCDKEVITLLQHMILSHHYEPEYGSPIKPMIPEAEMLHYLDILDARMYDMNKALSDVNKGEFSDRIWSLEGRKIYRPLNIE